MSMLRHAVDDEPTRPVTLFYSVRTEEDIAFRDETARCSTAGTRSSALFIAITERRRAAATVFPGRINEALLTTMVPDIAHAVVPRLRPAADDRRDDGDARVDRRAAPQIHFEVFQAAIAAAAGRRGPSRSRRRAAPPAGDADRDVRGSSAAA